MNELMFFEHLLCVLLFLLLSRFPRACSLTTDSVVDFGCLAASSRPIKRHHLITNKGSASGRDRCIKKTTCHINVQDLNQLLSFKVTK